MKTEDFAKNYAELEACAEKIKDTQTSEIESLLDLVTRAGEAYKKCAARIEIIAQLTGKAVGEDKSERANSNKAGGTE